MVQFSYQVGGSLYGDTVLCVPRQADQGDPIVQGAVMAASGYGCQRINDRKP
jgi:hypothetical protein